MYICNIRKENNLKTYKNGKREKTKSYGTQGVA